MDKVNGSAGKVAFLGLDFEPMETGAAVARLAERASAAGPFSYVVTPNADNRMRLERQPGLWPLYRSAGLEWLFRLASQPRRLAKRYLVQGPAIFRIWQAARRAKA